MNAKALYRTWRPQTFQDMVGQEHVIRTLQNAMREQRFSHAYLFSGPRGTGKTSAAKILAKAVNCTNAQQQEPCNGCDSCLGIDQGTLMDVIEIDAASNRGVDEIRDLRDKVKYAPTEAKRKVYIIDEVHMLTTEAFNALLKTLEEPPAHAMFVLATTEPHKLPATIISRCQRFEFRRITRPLQVERLRHICKHEGIEADDEALQQIARLSEGGMRDAVSLLDQAASFHSDHLTAEAVIWLSGGLERVAFREIAKALADGDAENAVQWAERIYQEGKSPERSLEDLMGYFRDLIMAKLSPETLHQDERIDDPNALVEAAEPFEAAQLFAALDHLNRYTSEIKFSSQPQTLLEVALLRICSEASHQVRMSDTASQTAQIQEDPARIQELQRELQALRTEWQNFMREYEGKANPESNSESQPVNPVKSKNPVDVKQKVETKSFSTSLTTEGTPQIAKYLAVITQSETNAIQKQWDQVLTAVRKAKITVHAWLIDGTPLGATADAVIIGYRSAMHRETTEKETNRILIEEQLEKVLNKPVKYVSCMKSDWDHLMKTKPIQSEPLEMVLNHEQESKDSVAPWVEEALRLFGADIVVVEDNRENK